MKVYGPSLSIDIVPPSNSKSKMSSFEERRRQNILDNKRILSELGLINPFKKQPKVVHKPINRKRRRSNDENTRPSKNAKKAFIAADTSDDLTPGSRRKSCRLQGKEAGSEPDLDNTDTDPSTPSTPRVAPNRPNTYGAIPGIPVGTHWFTRMACCHDGIHRPPVAGIHGNEEEGAYSLALSGGYEDDIDLGVCFTYTGEGGRDLKGTKNNPKNLRTAAQSKDQTLWRGNLALSKSVETGNPVRVIRGYKLDSVFAPEEGYRYDGLYNVEKYWFTTGLSGHGVYKFALKRIEEQDAPPWTLIQQNDSQDSGYKSDEVSSDGTGEKSSEIAKGAVVAKDEKLPDVDVMDAKMTDTSEKDDYMVDEKGGENLGKCDDDASCDENVIVKTDENKNDVKDESNEKCDESIEKCDETNEKCDEMNEKCNETNEKCDEINEKFDETNEKSDELNEKCDETNEVKDENIGAKKIEKLVVNDNNSSDKCESADVKSDETGDEKVDMRKNEIVNSKGEGNVESKKNDVNHNVAYGECDGTDVMADEKDGRIEENNVDNKLGALKKFRGKGRKTNGNKVLAEKNC